MGDVRKVGRPRVTSLPPDEMIKLGEEMIQWLEKHPETLHLSEWYTIEKMFLYNEWKKFIEKEEFRPYYERALKMVSRSYLNGKVHPSISQRWQRVYFGDLKEQEDADQEREIDLKTKAVQTVSNDIHDKFDKVMTQLDSGMSERKSAKIRTRIE